ncbi:MAG: hypothetical protein K0B87_00670 [Candidatus Syntrophosphaera sp.]|nr:hypothetical protein [Candidatus Syntrophosphaera sp.]
MNSIKRSPNQTQGNGANPTPVQVPEINILKIWRNSRQGLLTTRIRQS